MKINKQRLWFRVLLFPFKLVFMTTAYIIYGIMVSIQWVLMGGEEVIYGKDHGGKIVTAIKELIAQNEQLKQEK